MQNASRSARSRVVNYEHPRPSVYRNHRRLGRKLYRHSNVLWQPLERQASGRRVACASSEILPLGEDFLVFLGAFVIITPLFKKIDVSPILGFLAAGVILRYGRCFPGPLVHTLCAPPGTTAVARPRSASALHLMFVSNLPFAIFWSKKCGRFDGSDATLAQVALVCKQRPCAFSSPTTVLPLW